ncbi:glycoside hydrolase family 30 protein [Acerihabitans arboris]|uniref:Glycosyl hydrolase n=1 Tax=Acerihabitans arboris TaxID=2691583 RepID=A0A845SJU9_9GAMM|nr:glycoside hydrolase family 30 beta sandwich domain-containing protein [Acerihabitans arboris]NDL61605.1 glycosyl hydrolase [Acerihabitans arboris]
MNIEWIMSSDEAQWRRGGQITETTEAANLVLGEARGRKLEGFGGCFNELGMVALNALDKARQNAILDDLFSSDGECRLTMGRVPIGASDYAVSWYSLNEQEDDYAMEKFSIDRDKRLLLPYIKAALARQPNMTLFASPWSPPTWLKTHQACNFGRLRRDARTQEAYALYFRKFVEYYRAEGVPIAQVHIQNEVVADQKFPSCVWSGEQLRDFIKGYLGPRFRRDSVASEIWLGTINAPEFLKEPGQDYDDYANCVLSDPEAYRYVAGVGYQWAGKNAIQRTVMSYPELRYYQTENECGDGQNTWQYAHYVFGLFRHYLVNGANGYFYWNMVLADGGESTWGWKQNSMISVNTSTQDVVYNPEYYVMRHFSRLIQPGARMVPLTGAMSGNAVAFENQDGSVIVNLSNPSTAQRQLRLATPGNAFAMELAANSLHSFVLKPRA